jgi:hypothetical protein
MAGGKNSVKQGSTDNVRPWMSGPPASSTNRTIDWIFPYLAAGASFASRMPPDTQRISTGLRVVLRKNLWTSKCSRKRRKGIMPLSRSISRDPSGCCSGLARQARHTFRVHNQLMEKHLFAIAPSQHEPASGRAKRDRLSGPLFN